MVHEPKPMESYTWNVDHGTWIKGN